MPTGTYLRTSSLEARFWSYVNKEGPVIVPDLGSCWEWTSGLTELGYGRLVWKGSHLRAHRVSYEIAYGDVPDGLFVLHRCNNPPCVRPSHLYAGTQADNVQQAYNDGTKLSGENHHWAKLSNECVQKAFCLYAEGYKQYQIAEILGVTPPHISDILNMKKRRRG
jgi:hypothetical protein